MFSNIIIIRTNRNSSNLHEPLSASFSSSISTSRIFLFLQNPDTDLVTIHASAHWRIFNLLFLVGRAFHSNFSIGEVNDH
jgi:hypothetical protein